MRQPRTLRQWASAIDRYSDHARSAGLAESTITTRSTALRRLACHAQDEFADPYSVTGEALRRYINRRTWAPATYRANVKAIRAFYRWAADAGYIDIDPACNLPVNLPAHERGRMAQRAAAEPERVKPGPDRLTVPAPWAPLIDAHRRWMLAAGHTRQSTVLRRGHIERLSRALDPLTPEQVQFDDLLDFIADSPHWQTETRRGYRTSIRSFFAWMVADGRIHVDPAARLPRVKAAAPVPRPASERDYLDALTAAPERTRLMLRLAAELGLRRAEVAQIHPDQDLRPDSGGGYALTVHGKGRKVRVLPLPHNLAAAIRSYARPGEYLFGDSRHHLTPEHVGNLVKRALPPGVSMHQLRHRFATVAYNRSHDLLTVQQILGHASPATTQRYIAPDETTTRAVIDAAAPALNPRQQLNRPAA